METNGPNPYSSERIMTIFPSAFVYNRSTHPDKAVFFNTLQEAVLSSLEGN